MKKKRIKASDLQFRGYSFVDEEYDNVYDTVDLDDEFGTRLLDGTVIDAYEADNKEIADQTPLESYLSDKAVESWKETQRGYR